MNEDFTPLTENELDAIRGLDTPTISNSLERLDLRSWADGFMRPEIRAVFPEQQTVVGYAVTVTISASRRSDTALPRRAYWDAILGIPAPRFVVVHDRDYPNPVGSYWGEVQANIATSLGCVGAITDGGVRDLEESRELGFPYWAKEVLVSHAYVHSEMVNTPVDVGGLTVNPGDLLVADRHGVISIPRQAASRLPELARREHERESIVIGLCKSGEKVTPEKLQAAMDEMQEILRSGPSY